MVGLGAGLSDLGFGLNDLRDPFQPLQLCEFVHHTGIGQDSNLVVSATADLKRKKCNTHYCIYFSGKGQKVCYHYPQCKEIIGDRVARWS